MGFTEYSVKEQGNTTETVYYQFQKVGLQQVFYPLIDNTDYPVTVDSNSAILGIDFNQYRDNSAYTFRAQMKLPVSVTLQFLMTCYWATYH